MERWSAPWSVPVFPNSVFPNIMESRSLRLLEFSKILDFLSGFAVSSAAKERCRSLQPLGAPSEVQELNTFLEEFLVWADETRAGLSPFPSLEKVWDRVRRPESFLDAETLWEVKIVLEELRHAQSLLDNVGPERFPLLAARKAECVYPDMLWAGLKRCLDIDGRIKDESSPELFSVRQELRAIHTQCTRKVTEFIQARSIQDYLQDEYLTISSDRYVLALKSNFKGRLKGIIHDYSQSGETCYFEPFFLTELNNRLRSLKQEEREAEEQVLRYLTGLLRQEERGLKGGYDWLVGFDLSLAKAGFAQALSAVPLTIGEGLPLSLKGARHPLLALGSTPVQPIDIELREEERGLIISGGNAGGKTVCLKTLGLSAIMGLSGLPVLAAEGSTLPFLEQIFVFIGDEQSLEDQVSTFTAQIRNLSSSLPRVGPRTMVILDEFGAGTDPSQGAALAQAVIDELLDRSAWVAAATHFPALKGYGLTRSGLRSASVLFDPGTKRPLYTMAYAQVGTSLALDVAREHGLPESVLRKAERYLLLDGKDSSRLMERLNELALAREAELAELRRERQAMQQSMEKERQRLRKERTQVLSELKGQAQEIIREWKAGRLGRKEALRNLGLLRERTAKDVVLSPQSEGLSFEELSEGTPVFYPSWSKAGTVAAKDQKRRQVKIDFGGICIWADPGELLPSAQGAPERKSAGLRVQAERIGTSRLDLRGKRAEEAVDELSKFLDQATLSGLTDVEVIHGKGTGALRREIHDYLREHPSVQEFTMAPADQGGDGVTLVHLQ
jgi:DNA mismatch repair protein MutS2